MIHNLNFKFTFSNDVTIENDIELDSGSTLITGANGRGKSLTFEVISFLLFGSKALRGVASDYKRIKASMDITIKGERYTIKRTKSGSEVFLNDEMIVSGTSTVNPWIIKTLGYNFDVFRIAHWCAQGDIQALANMRPTERKQMIDDVAGLTSMDGLIKQLNAQIKEFKSEVAYIESQLEKPVEPVKPDTDPKSIKKIEDEVLGDEQTFLSLRAVSAPSAPSEPIQPSEPIYPEEPKALPAVSESIVEPQCPEGLPSTLGHLEKLIGQYSDKVAEIDSLNLQLSALSQFATKPKALPKKYATVEELKTHWQNYERYLLIEKLKADSEVECPKCGEQFCVDGVVDEMVKENAGVKTKPTISVDEYYDLSQAKLKHEQYLEVKEKLKGVDESKIKSELSRATEYFNKLKSYEFEKDSLVKRQQQIDSLYKSQLESHKRTVESIRQNFVKLDNQYKLQKADFDQRQAKYEDLNKAYQVAQVEIKTMQEKYGEDVAKVLSQMKQLVHAQRSEWNAYEAHQQSYLRDKQKYDELLKNLVEKKENLSQYTKAKNAVVEIKLRVQAHLLPSLNKVASSLMSEMTNGAYTKVEIQNNFEVFVDDQPLRTLSGSGKDLANLTLRIGLGRIITHKVLGVMLLDEIDSAMDDERSKYTWDCIERITPQVGQILQASHKDLQSENSITV